MSARIVTVKDNILGANREKAEAIRALLSSRLTVMINVMSASGSGKTSLITRTIEGLADRYKIAVIEGNVAPSIDADRFAKRNVPVIQINTGGGCHLDAVMVRKALERMDLDRLDLIFIENVANLVCTAEFDLGAHKNAVILSIPEGDDKPYKYPVMFADADAVLVNKIDVLPYFNFKLDTFPAIIEGMNPSAKLFPVSAKTGEGLDRWFSWLDQISAQIKPA